MGRDCLGFRDIIQTMQNHVEKDMESEMETRITKWEYRF